MSVLMQNRGAPLGLLFLVCVGCGVADAPARGFGSRQILAIRDPQLDLGDFTKDESKLYLVRYVAVPPPIGFYPPHDFSTLDLATHQRQPIAPAVFRVVRLAGESSAGGSQAGTLGGGRALALLHYPSAADIPPDFTPIQGGALGHLQLSFVNETTGRQLNISDVADRTPIIFGASDSDPIAVDRFDAAENVQVWFGPPDALQVAPVAFSSIIGFDATGAFGLMTLGGLGKPDIRHIPSDGGDPAIVVTADLGEHIVIPDESNAGIEPDPLSRGPDNPLYWCVPAASPEAPQRCFLVYTRAGADSGSARLVARATDDPHELVLPGVFEISRVLDNPLVFPSTTALLWTAGGPSGNRLYSWTFGADRVGGCDVPPGLIRGWAWTRTQDRFAVQIEATDADGRRAPGVLVLGEPGGACRVITPEARYYSFWRFSPGGALLNWHEPRATGTAIHLTATDGSGERRIDLPWQVFTSEFRGEGRLLLTRASGDGVGLSFIDLIDDPIRDHVIAERVASRWSWTWIDDHWLLLGDARSRQDDTFTLRAVNIDTGASRLVSSAVAAFVTPWTVRPAGATTLPVAYLVRGRAASPQDGIWLARLPLDDFLP